MNDAACSFYARRGTTGDNGMEDGTDVFVQQSGEDRSCHSGEWKEDCSFSFGNQ
jgi:hypothetical protein